MQRGSFPVANKIYTLSPVMSRSSSSRAGSDRFQPAEGSVEVVISGVDHYVSPADMNMYRAYDNSEFVIAVIRAMFFLARFIAFIPKISCMHDHRLDVRYGITV